MGNITGAMVFQSTIPTVVALVFASSTWHDRRGDRYVAFASAGIAFLSSAADLHPDGPLAARLRGRGLLVGGAFYLVYLALVAARAIGGGGRPDGRREPPGEPLAILGRPHPTQEPTPHARPTRRPTDTPAETTHHAPSPGRARRPDLLLRGRTTSRCATPRSAS